MAYAQKAVERGPKLPDPQLQAQACFLAHCKFPTPGEKAGLRASWGGPISLAPSLKEVRLRWSKRSALQSICRPNCSTSCPSFFRALYPRCQILKRILFSFWGFDGQKEGSFPVTCCLHSPFAHLCSTESHPHFPADPLIPAPQSGLSNVLCHHLFANISIWFQIKMLWGRIKNKTHARGGKEKLTDVSVNSEIFPKTGHR